ncbi:MAG: CPBP family intramembrane glutamic endopeptidase [Acidobacteriaceae bacterium]
MVHLSAPAANILLTCVALILAVLIPVWDNFYLKRWRRSGDPDKKVRLYRLTIAWLWGTTALACLLVPVQLLYRIHLDSAHAVGMLKGPFAIGISIGTLGGLVGGTAVHVLRVRTHPKAQSKVQKQLEKISIYLPQTARERRWFVAASFTAGICEEFLYRGFLIHYLHTLTWHLGLWVALIVSSVVFGLGHIYQGILGIAQTAVMGFLFAVLYVATGSLLVPIILHILIDLRVLLLLPKTWDAATRLSSVDAT